MRTQTLPNEIERASPSERGWRTGDFDFDLPEDRIAQTAIEPRDHARLLHVPQDRFADLQVLDLPDILQSGDLLVVNDTKVIPARLYGKRDGVTIEILLHQRKSSGIWSAFARPGKRLRAGDTVRFATGFEAEVIAKQDDGQVELRFAAKDAELMSLLEHYGEPPLPPYIKREVGQAKQDRQRYQTVYAARDGAVAAPTAGLHFTSELLERLRENGHETVAVTLHVGAGTFQPVKVDRIADHVMHSEWGEISADAAFRINKAKDEGRRIVAVGTTSLRLLESAAADNGLVLPYSKATDIFITPGYRFKAVDALMTNFHLPKSTLFMLVCAFAGYERMQTAYDHALAHNYRFYSYGDATFLEKQ